MGEVLRKYGTGLKLTGQVLEVDPTAVEGLSELLEVIENATPGDALLVESTGGDAPRNVLTSGTVGGGDLQAELNALFGGSGEGAALQVNDLSEVVAAPLDGQALMQAGLGAYPAGTVIKSPAGIVQSVAQYPTEVGSLDAERTVLVLQSASIVPTSGNLTTGSPFSVLYSRACSGVVVYWGGTTARTLKLAVWTGSTLVASGTVSTSGTAGLKYVTFASPATLTPGVVYWVTCYETSGTEYLSPTNQIRRVTPDYRPGWVRLAQYCWKSGDNQPTTVSDNNTYLLIAPVFS